MFKFRYCPVDGEMLLQGPQQDQCSCERCGRKYRGPVLITKQEQHIGVANPGMDIEDAIRIAGLWRGYKIIGGDPEDVAVSLLNEVERLNKVLNRTL